MLLQMLQSKAMQGISKRNMIEFSLSKNKEKILPTALKAEGRIFHINADFRNILKIFRAYADPEIPDNHKASLALRWFFTNDMPTKDIAMQLLADFLGIEERHEETNIPQQMDYEFDAGEIYASFLQEYAIDLLEIEFLHWYKFRILLASLGADTALGRKISLRNLDTKQCKDRPKAERAKAEVQIPQKISVTEYNAQQRLEEILLHGGDPREILR